MGVVTQQTTGPHEKIHGHNTHQAGTAATVMGTNGAGQLAEIDFSATAEADKLALRDGSGQLAVPTTPTANGHAASKAYVDAQTAGGKAWKEIVLAVAQLIDGASGGVAQAIALAFDANLQADDTIILEDGQTTETLTAVAGAPGANQFQVGGSAAATLANLVAAINSNSSKYGAANATGLDPLFASEPAAQAVIYREDPSSAGASASRLYGVIANDQADVQVANFGGTKEYAFDEATVGDLPSTDPGSATFGFGRAYANLRETETHKIVDDSTDRTWDSDDEQWVQSGGGTITAGDGLVQSGAAFNLVAADNSLDVQADEVSVNVDGSTIETDGSAGVRVKDSGITPAKTSFYKGVVACAGAVPADSDVSGTLTAEGQYCLAEGTGGRSFLVFAVDVSSTIKRFAVEAGELA